jgi:hypothetical protein
MSDEEENNVVFILQLIFAVVIFALTIWWGIYKYHDCLKVGHTKTYCIIDFAS